MCVRGITIGSSVLPLRNVKRRSTLVVVSPEFGRGASKLITPNLPSDDCLMPLLFELYAR